MGVKNELFPLKCIWLLLHCLARPRWQVMIKQVNNKTLASVTVMFYLQKSILLLKNINLLISRLVSSKIRTFIIPLYLVDAIN
jgi:hypothetical protein